MNDKSINEMTIDELRNYASQLQEQLRNQSNGFRELKEENTEYYKESKKKDLIIELIIEGYAKIKDTRK